MELRPIAISPRLAGLHRDPLRIELDLAHPPQRLREDLALQPQLRLVRGMLILATAAAHKVRAFRLYTVRRSFGHAHQTRPLRILPRPRALRLHHFAGQYKRRETTSPSTRLSPSPP